MPDLKIKKLGVVAKPHSALAPGALARVKKWADGRGMALLIDERSAKAAEGLAGETMETTSLFSAADAVLVLGGDGTFLGAARRATGRGTPLLGINLGSLGFMTEVAVDEMERALDELADGSYDIEERIMLGLEVGSGKNIRREEALNEVVFSNAKAAKMVELSLSVNGQHVTDYRSDGLIISTPTGSTAYALSSGGPILYPTLDALLICPICPHTLTNRPIVVPRDSVIAVEMGPAHDEIIATLDGQIPVVIRKGDRVSVARSGKITRIVKVPERTHFDTLRSKLGWGGSPTSHGGNIR